MAKLIYSAFTSLDGGSGNAYLPGKVPVKLELLDERRFDKGMVLPSVPSEELTS